MTLQGMTAAFIGGAIMWLGNYLFNAPQQSANALDAVKRQVAELGTVNAVQDNKIETMGKDITEIKSDVKNILKAVRPDDYRPAVSEVPKNALLITGTKKDGSPNQ